ncbi:hypothetical protein BJF85_08260 [Saccharomonospora sp. CUA-673]|nr:hypothetical protein BJF85_08260 [Saccharomonospora sp. CUA-673]
MPPAPSRNACASGSLCIVRLNASPWAKICLAVSSAFPCASLEKSASPEIHRCACSAALPVQFTPSLPSSSRRVFSVRLNALEISRSASTASPMPFTPAPPRNRSISSASMLSV